MALQSLPEAFPTKLFINGEFVDAADKRTYNSINPANEQVIAPIGMAGKSDLEAAISAAEAAFPAWAAMPASKRSNLIWKIGEEISKRRDAFAALEAADAGKPIRENASIDVPMAADHFKYFAGILRGLEGETIPVNDNMFVYTLREPLGIVAGITPWNFPLLMACRKIAPALAAGNCVILKPANPTPLTSLLLAECIQAAKIPPGVVAVLPGKGSEVGQQIVEHPKIAAISFTGSTSVGIKMVRDAAQTLKKLTMELGGKSPNVIFADADLDSATKGAQAAIFYNKGEVCTAGSRLFVEDKVHDEVVEKLAARTAKTVGGDPLDDETRYGPQNNAEQFKTTMDYIAKGKAEGAKLVAGGERMGDKGYFVKPTVFADVKPEMAIAREEIFGPVLAVQKFSEFDELVAKANASEYGLAAGVWTRDVSKAHRYAKAIKAGAVWVNCYNWYDSAVPYGGYKQSGYGREMGIQGLYAMTQQKSVWVQL
ncbi:MAG: aldehyde dehydrogenase family protein [Planctomycetes bacterium]|nr:aldehyde dehydrogenase family protein [Planctomycetota bacterium]MCW8136921.1 aldehyde dehydrogenase family protein [Planctomycetota bacterium]